MNYFIGIIFFYFLFMNNFISSTSKLNFKTGVIPYFTIFNSSNVDSNQNSNKQKNKKTHLRKNNYIKLKTTNVINLKGPISEKTVNKFLLDFNLHTNKEDLYVFIDSPGGSVEDGYKIITEFQKYNVSCIAEKAYSMAFAIFQSCNERLLLPHGKLMQHQISLGIINELGKIKSYIDYILQIEKELLHIQSSKIGITSDNLKNKTNNEWWMFGKNALHENCADKIVNVECTEELVQETVIISDSSYYYIYSKCPLIPNYLEKIEISS